MRTIAIFLAALVLLANAATAKKRPTTDPSTQPSDKPAPTEIKVGITLADAERIAGARATPVGAPNGGNQAYRLVSRQAGAGNNSHPKIVFYMLSVNYDGIIVNVRK